MLLMVIVALFVVVGAFFGWAAFFRINELSRQLDQLRQELRGVQGGAVGDTEGAGAEEMPEALSSTRPRETVAAPVSPTLIRNDDRAASAVSPPAAPTPKPVVTLKWVEFLKEHWMVTLGGACLALAGIFLARYSIEQGLLGPGARFTFGILLGVAMIAGAEYLRRQRPYHQAFAALAAGGSITLYAAFLAALHLYQLIGPVTAFVVLALVGLASMWLALWHGPILAAIGLLGAYLVPLLIGSSGQSAAYVLLFSLIISSSALLLMRYVYRDWLLMGMLAGALGWLFLTLGLAEIDGFRGLYLAALAYLLLALPAGDWRLQQSAPALNQAGLRHYLQPSPGLAGMLPLSLVLIMLTQVVAMISTGLGSNAVFNWLPLSVLLLVAGHKQSLRYHAWLLMLLQMLAIVFLYLVDTADGFRLLPIPTALHASFYQYCLIAVVLHSGAALYHMRRSGVSGTWVSLAVLAPLLFLTLAYILSGDNLGSLQWSLMAIVLGGSYIGLGSRLLAMENQRRVSAWLFIGGHLAYSLAVAMFFEAASMTLALSVQIVSLAWVIRRFDMGEISWLLKLVVGVVIVRLTFNPWLFRYADGLHWSLWTYGGATACCALGSHLLRELPQLRKWTTGAAIHLLALTLWTELRYWLYDGDIMGGGYDFLEAALNVGLFGTLAVIYHLRSGTSEHLGKLYSLYARGLLVFAGGNYALILLATLGNAPWVWGSIAETKLFNLMLLAFGVPVLIGYLVALYFPAGYRKAARVFTALAGFIFITLEIRHLWHGDLRLDHAVMSGELYSYSAVWLVLAIAAILGGVWRFGQQVYRAGLGLLILVLAKLFLVDMSDLEGLLRVASFLGMGLALLATAYLHQRLNFRTLPDEQATSGQPT